MTTKQFIEKAIEGEYKYPAHLGTFPKLEQILLDPKFWQAVGKVEGWTEICDNPDHGFIQALEGIENDKFDTGRLGCPVCGHSDDHVVESTRYKWRDKMHSMIDALAEGKSIKEFLKTL